MLLYVSTRGVRANEIHVTTTKFKPFEQPADAIMSFHKIVSVFMNINKGLMKGVKQITS
jgi:hypothetical protein